MRAYYQSINRRDYQRAYSYLALPGRLPYETWVRGYRDTQRVTIGQIIVPGYRIPENGSRYTCVGVHFTARQMGGRSVTYGGWYLTPQVEQP